MVTHIALQETQVTLTPSVEEAHPPVHSPVVRANKTLLRIPTSIPSISKAPPGAPRPLYVPTAHQLGLIPSRQIPARPPSGYQCSSETEGVVSVCVDV